MIKPLKSPLAETLRQRIERGECKPGSRLGSIRQVAEQEGLSRHAVLTAYQELVGLGLAEARHGSGFYVSSFLRPSDAPAHPAPSLDRLLDTALLIRGFLEPTNLLKCGSGMLPRDWLQDLTLPRHVRAVAAQPSADLTDYGTALGFPPLREALQGRLARRRIPAQPEQILLTTGISHGFELVLRALCRPGDLVFVENPAYYNLFGLLHLSGLRWREIPRTPQGPDLDVLENLLKQGDVPRLCLLQPQLHNPTGNSMGPAAAHRLLLLAEQFNFHVVEDDAYSDLAEDADLRLAALDGLRRVIYLSGFTKTLSANLRVGYVAASAPMIDAIARAKLLTCIASSEFAERVVLHVLTDGAYDRLMPLLRQRLAAAQATWENELARTEWQIFPGERRGMFIWARHPRWPDSVPLAQAATSAGLWLAPGSAFDPEHRVSPWIRFNVAYRSSALSAWLKKQRIHEHRRSGVVSSNQPWRLISRSPLPERPIGSEVAMSPLIMRTGILLLLFAALPVQSQILRCTEQMIAIPDHRLEYAIDKLKRDHPHLVFPADDPCLQSAGTIRALARTLQHNYLKKITGYEFVKVVNNEWYFTVERFRLKNPKDLKALEIALDRCRNCKLQTEANTRLDHFSAGDSIVFMVSSAVGGEENTVLFQQIRTSFLASPEAEAPSNP